MKIGYLDCFSGISGDMCLGVLVDAGVPIEALQVALAKLPVGGFRLEAEQVKRAGIAATRVHVHLDEHEHHPHRGLHDVLSIIEGGELPERVTQRASAVFRCLAEAEAHVHQTDVDHVHFHEVGAVDAICDIVGAAVGIEELGLDGLLFSTVSLGGGTVKAAHGVLPVPAPATAELLAGLPVKGGPVDFELTTPTGAAILKALGESSPQWPGMSVEALGYGAGSRDMSGLPNVLRLAVGEAPAPADAESDCIWVVECNLDDMTGEEVGYCLERLMAAGALDAFATPIQMKKNRPAVKLTVLCEPQNLRGVEAVFWRDSSTLGVRRSLCQRSKLRRQTRTAATPWGEVAVKLAYLGDELVRREPEYESCRALAEAHRVPLREVYRAALGGHPEGD